MGKFLLLFLVLFASCESLYEVGYADAEHKKPLIDQAFFTFPAYVDKSVYKIIDTSAVYVHAPKTSYSSQYISIKFSANGECIVVNRPSDHLQVSDFKVYPQSPEIGRYRITGNSLEIERFYRNGPMVKKYTKIITKGEIIGDVITLTEIGEENVYKKSKKYSFVQGRLEQLR